MQVKHIQIIAYQNQKSSALKVVLQLFACLWKNFPAQ